MAPGCFSCVTGDFDGQGISFGALQWNFGQGSLQPILERMLRNHREVIKDAVKRQIFRDFEALPRNLAPGDLEVRKMRSVANRRAEAAKPEFVKDVRSRKLCIADGKGTVHGIAFVLGEQFGIGLEAF